MLIYQRRTGPYVYAAPTPSLEDETFTDGRCEWCLSAAWFIYSEGEQERKGFLLT